MSALLLQTENLICRRKGRALFAPINLAIGAGALVMLQGPNGSGKTSLLRALAGLLPHEGRIRREAKICYIGHRLAVHSDLSPEEHLDFWGALSERPASQNKILERLGLENLVEHRAATLSSGQKQRLALCRLLLSEARLWLLDEPFASLDAEGTGLLAVLIAQHRERGGAAIIASHGAVLPEAQPLSLGT